MITLILILSIHNQDKILFQKFYVCFRIRNRELLFEDSSPDCHSEALAEESFKPVQHININGR